MIKTDTYTLFPDETDSSFENNFDIFNDSDDSKHKKHKKKGKKKKMKKHQKKLEKLLAEKKGKKSKGKSKKKAKREFQYRLVEKSADTILETTSDIVRMYAESKLYPSGRNK